jgi:hypothetical protein
MTFLREKLGVGKCLTADCNCDGHGLAAIMADADGPGFQSQFICNSLRTTVKMENRLAGRKMEDLNFLPADLTDASPQSFRDSFFARREISIVSMPLRIIIRSNSRPCNCNRKLVGVEIFLAGFQDLLSADRLYLFRIFQEEIQAHFKIFHIQK